MTSPTTTAVPAGGAVIHVVAGALIAGSGAVLIQRRHADSHQGGLWEFPGGKLEPGEQAVDGLRRELREELGVEIGHHRPLIRVRHDYRDRRVLLDVYRITGWSCEPVGKEGQPLTWVEPARLADYPMPLADGPIVAALRLPTTYMITPPRIQSPSVFVRALERVLDDGVRLVQLRVFDLARREFEELGRTAVRCCHAQNARLLVNGSPQLAVAIGADGVHLDSRSLRRAAARPLSSEHLVAASCHSRNDLAAAAGIGADFALLSPVLPTRSHPDADPLGWSRFAELVEAAALPVYALGGMRPDMLADAWRHGAQGIAGIRGLWPEKEPNP